MISFEERFWSKVQKSDGCWNWTACLDKDGYGMLFNKKVVKAHRASWLLAFGEIPNGLHVLHKCDNPRCVNPEHLWLGTNLQNMQDKMRKGRFALGDRTKSTGVKSHFAKLNEKQVIEIRKLSAIGQTYKAIAAQFSISFQQVGSIVNRKAWAHVNLP